MSEMLLAERFERLGFPSETALRFVSVLLWIQLSVEIPDLLNIILSTEDNVFSVMAEETAALLGFLSNHAVDSASLSFSHLQTLVSASRSGSPLITTFLCDRERVRASVDANYRKLSTGEGRVREGLKEESRSAESLQISSHASTSTAMEKSHQSSLNPAARAFIPVISIDRGSEDERCLYLTFSKGHPLRSSEIAVFFREMCNKIGEWRQNPKAVETVYVHKGEDGTALFGKVVFCNPYLPGFFLGMHKEIKFIVNGKTLWCKRFVPKSCRNNLVPSPGENSQARAPRGGVGFGGSGVGYTAGIGPGWAVGHQFLGPFWGRGAEQVSKVEEHFG